MNIALALIVFLVAALLIWGIAEAHYKDFHYEEDKPHHPDPTAQKGPHKELNIRDIMRDNSTSGYNAVGENHSRSFGFLVREKPPSPSGKGGFSRYNADN